MNDPQDSEPLHGWPESCLYSYFCCTPRKESHLKKVTTLPRSKTTTITLGATAWNTGPAFWAAAPLTPIAGSMPTTSAASFQACSRELYCHLKGERSSKGEMIMLVATAIAYLVGEHTWWWRSQCWTGRNFANSLPLHMWEEGLRFWAGRGSWYGRVAMACE